jgi:hypothetical protein
VGNGARVRETLTGRGMRITDRTLHERWRMTGFAGEEHDQRLWKQFKKAGDQFRRLREAHYAEVKRNNKLEKSRARD